MATMFQHRHYEAIAAVFAEQTAMATDEHRVHDVFAANQRDGVMAYREGFLLMCDLANLFAQDNPHFDLARFERACGHEAGVIAAWLPDRRAELWH